MDTSNSSETMANSLSGERRKQALPVALEKRRGPGEDDGPEATDGLSMDALAAQQLAERRKRNIPVAIDRRRANAAEKRRTSERRRLIDPTTCERDYTDEETLFMKAMERYKRENRRPFPTWSEVLEVMRSLGYRKVAEETDLPGIKKDAGAPLKG